MIQRHGKRNNAERNCHSEEPRCGDEESLSRNENPVDGRRDSSPQLDPARLPELYEAVCQLHGSLELEEVIDHTLQAAIKLTGAERAFIQFFDRYSLYALPKLATETRRLIETALGELTHTVAQNRQGLLIADTQNDPRFVTEPLSTLFTSRSLRLTPLQPEKRFFGVLIADKDASADVF